MSKGNGPDSKPCPKCGVGKIMVGERYSLYNPRLPQPDGRQVCPDCFLHYLYSQHLDNKD